MENKISEEVKETKEEAVERPYTLRKLKDSDLFPLLQLLRKIGLKDFKEAFSQVAEGNDVRDIGIDVVLSMADKIICNLDIAQNEIYALWSNLSGIPVDEMKEMEFCTLPLMIYDSFNEVKNTAFFKVLSKLL